VRTVPADGTLILAHDDQTVEQRDSEQELLERFRRLAGVDLLVGLVLLCTQHHLLYVPAGFNGHLDPVLQNLHWKLFARVGSQEEALLRVDSGFLEVFHEFLQRLNPGQLQVSVLVEQPGAIFRKLFEH